MAERPGAAVQDALQRLDLLVVSSLFRNTTTALAHVVLPALGFAEKEGSFTNHQGRIQQIHCALDPPGACRSIAAILRGLAQRLGRDLGGNDPGQVWADIGARSGPYQGIDWKAIGREGILPSDVHGEQSKAQADRRS